MSSKGLHGRSSPWDDQEKGIVSTRLKQHDDGGSFTVASSAYDHNVATSHSYFRSDAVSDSTYSTAGYDGGFRHFLRIKSDNDFIIKFDSASNRGYKIAAADTPFECVTREFNNIFLRSAATTTAQVQHIHTVADVDGSLNNTYFYLYCGNNSLGTDRTIGVWMNVNSLGVQPTDSAVDAWVVVALATDATDAEVGTAVEAAIEAITVPVVGVNTDAFASSVSTADITVTHNATFGGAQKNAADSAAAPTGFTFDTPTTEGAGAALAISLFMV